MKKDGMLATSWRSIKFAHGFVRPWALPYILGMLVWGTQDFYGNYMFALLYQGVVAALTEGGGMNGVLRSVAVFVAMQIGFDIVFWSMTYWGGIRVQTLAQFALENRLLMRLLRARDSAHTGEDATLVVNDTERAIPGILQQTGYPVLSSFALIGCSAVVISVDWRLWAMAVCGGIVCMVIDFCLLKPNRVIGERAQQAVTRANRVLTDIISGSLAVRLLGLAGIKGDQYRRETQCLRELGMRGVRLRIIENALMCWRSWMLSVGILGIGCIFVARGEYPLSSLMLLVPMLGQLMYKFSLVANALLWMQPMIPCAQRAEAALGRPTEDLRPEGERVARRGSCALDLRDVCFAYEGRDVDVLQNVSFCVNEGEVVALVGASGSGKTTVFRMLLGMIAPGAGEVRLWGSEMRSASLESWRQGLAYVPQDAPLFDGSIGENIAYGAPGSGEDAIRQAARRADLADFLADVPEGLDTQTGTLGARISGGQRQRVAIARAFLRNAPVLLLDEATSSLDAESEAEVQSAIHELMRGRTVLVAAHRLSTVRHADRILVMEQGRIAESGTHEQLLEKNGVYAQLWQAQAQ